MMHEEFERLAGYEVSLDDYNNIIEPMYMASKLDKAEFVKIINKKHFALRPLSSIVKEMKEIGEHLRETCTMYIDFKSRERLEELAREYINRKGWQHYAGYMVNTKVRQTCYYPETISIYGLKDYRDIEVIKIA